MIIYGLFSTLSAAVTFSVGGIAELVAPGKIFFPAEFAKFFVSTIFDNPIGELLDLIKGLLYE